MQTQKILLIRYGEVALRRGNRAFYEHQIMNNIRRNLKPLHSGNIRVVREQGRFLIEDVAGDLDIPHILPHIRHIFGITAICPGIKTKAQDIDHLSQLALAFYREHAQGAATYKVEAKRSDKRYPLQSTQIAAHIGGYIWDHIPNPVVDVHNPAFTLHVELRNDAYIYARAITGEGGLPYGSAGQGVLLLSGGIDSPVAGYLAARRGVGLQPVYFHSPPFVSERALDKVRGLTAELARFTGALPLQVVPFTDVQMYLKEHTPPEKLTIFLKRAMLHIANRIAAQTKAHCLITGDSVGQVASQTLHSLAAVNSAATLPILRPLTTMDKQDIIDIAKRINTFDISTRPYEDCCTLFVAKHPENKPNTAVIERMEDRLMHLELASLIQTAAENRTKI